MWYISYGDTKILLAVKVPDLTWGEGKVMGYCNFQSNRGHHRDGMLRCSLGILWILAILRGGECMVSWGLFSFVLWRAAQDKIGRDIWPSTCDNGARGMITGWLYLRVPILQTINFSMLLYHSQVITDSVKLKICFLTNVYTCKDQIIKFPKY